MARKRLASSGRAAAALACVPLFVAIHTAEAFCPNVVGTTTALASRHPDGDTPHCRSRRRASFPAYSTAIPSCKLSSPRVASNRRRTRRRRFKVLSASSNDEYDDSQEELTNPQQQQLQSPAAANSKVDAELVDKGGVSKDRLAFEELGTREVDRLFSTLEPCDVSGFKRKPTNLLDAASLIGGTAVGAGILALPAATLQAGVVPSSVGLVMMWVYMVCTALLIAEVNVNVICSQGTPGVGLIALAEQALGKGGARFTGLVYVFIHYSLLVAYMAQGGGILTESFNSVFATVGSNMASLPEWAGPVGFCIALGSLVLFFSEEFVASFNSVLVAVVLISFVGLVGVGSGGVHTEYLTQQDWSKVPSTVPVLYIALVFHNVVPVVTTQLEGDVDKIRKAIIGGSLAPLLMFLVWNAVILGSVSKDAGLVAEAAGGVFDPLQALRSSAGNAEGSAALIGPLVSIFSEVAIVTSFIGFIVGLLDFFTDVLKIPPGDTSKEIPLYGAILLPPLGVAVTDPDIFFAALDTAGTFGISLLCGVLPAAMAWRQRYGGDSTIATLPLVPGGKATLAGIAGFAGVVIFQKLLEMAGLTLPA